MRYLLRLRDQSPRLLSHALVWLGVVASALPVVAVDQIPWANDLPTAMRIAGSRNQLVLLHFMSNDCAPCRRIESTIFSDAIFAQSLAEAFVPVKVNVSIHPEMARQFNVNAWPTDVVLAPNGTEIHRMISQQDRTQYLNSLRQVAWGYRSQPNTTSLAAARTQAPGVWPPQGSGGPAISSGSTPTVGDQPFAPSMPAIPPAAVVSSNPQAAVAPSSSPSSTGPLMYENSYVQGASYAGQEGPPALPADGAANPASAPGYTPGATPPPATNYPAQAASPQASPMASDINMSPPAIPPMMPAPPAPTTSAGPPSGMAQASYGAPGIPTAPAAIDVAAPPAMDGFCPVAVMDENRWIPGDKRWGARHRGRLYLFHDAASMQKFWADPERYSPSLAGYDPVTYAEKNQLVPGRREHGLRFDNQMYLFDSEASLARFEQNPDFYAGHVRQALQSVGQYR